MVLNRKYLTEEKTEEFTIKIKIVIHEEKASDEAAKHS